MMVGKENRRLLITRYPVKFDDFRAFLYSDYSARKDDGLHQMAYEEYKAFRTIFLKFFGTVFFENPRMVYGENYANLVPLTPASTKLRNNNNMERV